MQVTPDVRQKRIRVFMFGIKLIIWIMLFLTQISYSTEQIFSQETTSGLEFFGFAVVDCGWDAPNDQTSETCFVEEVAGFTNVAQMSVYSPSESIDVRISQFNRVGIRAILHVEALLFSLTADATSPSGLRLNLRDDAATRWYQFVKVNSRVLSAEHIAAIYVVDEPVWNGLEQGSFEPALSLVKGTYPEIPTLAIEAYPVMDEIMVPETLDWVGFDRYDIADPANDKAWLGDLETLREAITRNDQRIVIVASTQWLPYYQHEAGITPAGMEAVIESYYSVAVSDPQVVALIGYLWPGGLDDPAQLGARDLPENVQDTIRDIGMAIIGGQQQIGLGE